MSVPYALATSAADGLHARGAVTVDGADKTVEESMPVGGELPGLLQFQLPAGRRRPPATGTGQRHGGDRPLA